MLAYRFLIALAFPALLAGLVWRVLRGQEGTADLAQRLGGGLYAPHGAVWLHAASNGELTSARPLIETLLARRPDLHLLITTNTVSAQDLAASWRERRITTRLAPLDLRWIVRRFLERHEPAALIMVENELWPNRLRLTAEAGLPIAFVGARMSEGSARNWQKIGLGPEVMATISAFSAQDAGSEARFVALGLPRDRILPVMNLKGSVTLAPPSAPLDWPRGQTVLAASTHEGEETLILEAFRRARERVPELRLILAPRHPRRSGEVAELVRKAGLGVAIRSKGEAPTQPVYLADTLGEMSNWYASAGICVIGGTFAPKGGHTPFEPTAQGAAVLHGPDISNFADAFTALDTAGAAVLVQDAAALAETLATLSAEEQARMAQAAARALAPLSPEGGPGELADRLLERFGPALAFPPAKGR